MCEAFLFVPASLLLPLENHDVDHKIPFQSPKASVPFRLAVSSVLDQFA